MKRFPCLVRLAKVGRNSAAYSAGCGFPIRRNTRGRYCALHGHPSPTNASAGFTLIEVLISVVVLAIGLLGMAALQMNGLRNNQSAYFRSQATQLAYDMADRMRTNIEQARAGAYNNGTATSDNCETGVCITTAMTGYDFSRWNADLAAQLPSGVGRVCIDSKPNINVTPTMPCDGSGTVYAIKVWWDDDRSGTSQYFVMSFQPWN